MTCKAWRSTMCSRFNKRTWIPVVLCTIYNWSPENFYDLFLTSIGKNETVRHHIHCSKFTLINTYFCFRLLIIVASKIDQYQKSLAICSNRCTRNTGVLFSLLSKTRSITWKNISSSKFIADSSLWTTIMWYSNLLIYGLVKNIF
jgi:hypothetical protein